MAEPAAETPVFSPERTRGLRRMLLVVAALAGVLVLLSIATAIAGVTRFAVVVGVIGVALLVSSGLTLRGLASGSPLAKAGCIITAVFLMIFAIPLTAVWVGLLMVIAGVGLLFLLFAPERDPA